MGAFAMIVAFCVACLPAWNGDSGADSHQTSEPAEAVRRLSAEFESAQRSAFEIARNAKTAAERKAADHRDAAGPEHGRLREACSLTIAIEKTVHAHAFGMIAAEPGVYSEDLFKTVDEPDRCQFMRTEPAPQIEKP